MGGIEFVNQCLMFLLTMDLVYFVAISVCVLVVCGLIKFIMTIKDDVRIFEKPNRKTIRRRKNHRRRTQDIDSICD